jgi:hypothetical protein
VLKFFAGYETARLSPTRCRSLGRLELYAGAGTRIEFAAINACVLARGTANVLRRGERVPPSLAEAVQDLSRAVGALADYLEVSGGPEETRRGALETATEATKALKARHDIATSVLVGGQVRSMAVDLMRSTGMDQAGASPHSKRRRHGGRPSPESVRLAAAPHAVRDLFRRGQPFAVAALKVNRARQVAEKLAAGPAWREHSYIFPTRGGPRSVATTCSRGPLSRSRMRSGTPSSIFANSGSHTPPSTPS